MYFCWVCLCCIYLFGGIPDCFVCSIASVECITTFSGSWNWQVRWGFVHQGLSKLLLGEGALLPCHHDSHTPWHKSGRRVKGLCKGWVTWLQRMQVRNAHIVCLKQVTYLDNCVSSRAAPLRSLHSLFLWFWACSIGDGTDGLQTLSAPVKSKTWHGSCLHELFRWEWRREEGKTALWLQRDSKWIWPRTQTELQQSQQKKESCGWPYTRYFYWFISIDYKVTIGINCLLFQHNA